jgi:hypothetical protein
MRAISRRKDEYAAINCQDGGERQNHIKSTKNDGRNTALTLASITLN